MGDVIDFLNTAVTRVNVVPNLYLTVIFGKDSVSYGLTGQQANTKFKLQSDGHGGTKLTLIKANAFLNSPAELAPDSGG